MEFFSDLSFFRVKLLFVFISIVKYNYFAEAHKEVSVESNVAALILRAAQGVRGAAGVRLWGPTSCCPAVKGCAACISQVKTARRTNSLQPPHLSLISAQSLKVCKVHLYIFYLHKILAGIEQ